MRLFLTLAILLLLAGCTRPSAPLTSAPAPLDDVAAALPGLPTPADIPRSTSAATGLTRRGAEFLPLTANRVDTAGALAAFAPDFAGPGSAANALGYGVYEFNATGLSGAGSLAASWHTAPAAGNGVVGLSDWASGRWEWRLLSGAGTSVELDDLEPYVHTVDGRLLALVLVGDTNAARLTELRLDQPPPTPYWRLSQLNVDAEQVDFLRLFELGGRPAVTYWRFVGAFPYTESDIVLQRALDTVGEHWGPPQVIWQVPMTGGYTGKVHNVLPLIVEGRLSVVADLGGDDIEFLYHIDYLRALNDEATSFLAPVTAVIVYEAFPQVMDATVVDGHAVILRHDAFGLEFYANRAVDAEGSSWSTIPLDESEGVDWHRPRGLLTANGLAAALYPFKRTDLMGSPYELRFRRAANPEMSGPWATPQVVRPTPRGLFPTYPVTLADGRPAYLAGEDDGWAFNAANDLLGDNWPLGTSVPDMEGVFSPAVKTIGGVPALCYRHSVPEALYYRPASNPTGTAWEAQQTVYSGEISGVSMGEFQGHPALSATLPDVGFNRYPVFFIYR